MDARVYKADGRIYPVDPIDGESFSLEELQAIVGGLIEIIYLPDGKIMVLNEEGKYSGLEPNDNATVIANIDPDFIVGDVLVCRSSQVR